MLQILIIALVIGLVLLALMVVFNGPLLNASRRLRAAGDRPDVSDAALKRSLYGAVVVAIIVLGVIAVIVAIS